MGVGAGIARPISFCAPILFFPFFEKEKNRRGVRRSQLHCASAGAAKAPYPQPSSSFPNCDRFTGSQFGHLEFYNAARDLDDGGQAAAYEYCNIRTALHEMKKPGHRQVFVKQV